jgi:hypothetical protein
LGVAASVTVAALATSGCGEYVRQGRSPAQLVIVSLLTVRGAGTVPTSGFTAGPLLSDVPNVTNNETVFDDFGQVTFRQILRDQGVPGATAAPTPINDITITEYEVQYRLPNGSKRPGVDVPYPVRGAVTVSLQGTSTTSAIFELVRHVAKLEPPLASLGVNPVVLTVIADVTFFGHDQAGNSVSATGSVQINFANFN